MSTLTKVSFLALTILGGAAVHGISIKTGYYDMINSYKEKKILADGTPYAGTITSIAPLDNFLFTLVQFFWPCVDGKEPGLSLLTFLFGGQATALISIILLEGWRNGNRGKAISFVSVYGALFQAAGIALVGPAYLLLYTLTSPTLVAPTPGNLAIDPGLLSGIPFALTVGFVAPSAVLVLPSPSILSTQGKINAIAAWQPSPIYAVILAYIWKAFSSNSTASPREQIRKYRNVYKYALAVAVPAHIATLTLSISSVILPQIFTPYFANAFHPLKAIIPANPLQYSATTVSNQAQGALSFLQWDFLTASVSYMILCLNARFTKAVDPKGFTAAELGGMLGRIAVMGPLATALTYLWERDEIVFGKVVGDKKIN